jgi:hypothetical protein
MYFDRKRNYAKLNLLTARMKSMGYSVRQVAQMLNVPYTTFWNKMNGYGEFHTSEIAGLKSLLLLSDEDVAEIFLEQYYIFFDRALA